MRLLRLRNTPILEQLRIEEALLRADTGSWLVVNTGSPQPTIVLGISGYVAQLKSSSLWLLHPSVAVGSHRDSKTCDIVCTPCEEHHSVFTGIMRLPILVPCPFQIELLLPFGPRCQKGSDSCRSRWILHTYRFLALDLCGHHNSCNSSSREIQLRLPGQETSRACARQASASRGCHIGEEVQRRRNSGRG